MKPGGSVQLMMRQKDKQCCGRSFAMLDQSYLANVDQAREERHWAAPKVPGKVADGGLKIALHRVCEDLLQRDVDNVGWPIGLIASSYAESFFGFVHIRCERGGGIASLKGPQRSHSKASFMFLSGPGTPTLFFSRVIAIAIAVVEGL